MCIRDRGYPGRRYYGGCEFVDVAESLAIERAKQVFGGLEKVGIDMDDVIALLEREGVEKFVTAWQDLLDSTETKLNS